MLKPNKPFFFKPIRAKNGAWCIEIYDIKMEAMGICSENMAPLAFETMFECETAARKRGLRPMREHG